MCGRFTLTASVEELCRRFDAIFQGEDWHPRYNIAPSQPILTVSRGEDGGKILVPRVWGLIPAWSKERSIGLRMINARAETLDTKASFKRPLKSHRCLIPADGFFEWRKEDKKKVPMRIVTEDRGLFAFAGLWDRWHDPETNEIVESATIITTPANKKLESIHDRMPAILSPRHEDAWLDPGSKDIEKLLKLLSPFPSGKIDAYEVASVVNSWKNDTPACIEPVAKKK